MTEKMELEFADAMYRVAQRFAEVGNEMTLPHVLMRPRIFMDGNKWCALYGEDLQCGVAGFGDSPSEACNHFNAAWLKSANDKMRDARPETETTNKTENPNNG